MPDQPPRGLRRFIVALLAVYVAKELVVACISPPFTGHDEVAHFQGIRIFATERRIPTLWHDTLPADLYQYHAYSIEWRGRDDSPLYTAVHPPLYYVLMAPGLSSRVLRFSAIDSVRAPLCVDSIRGDHRPLRLDVDQHPVSP